MRQNGPDIDDAGELSDEYGKEFVVPEREIASFHHCGGEERKEKSGREIRGEALRCLSEPGEDIAGAPM